MALLDPTQAVGDVVKMARTNPLHLTRSAAFGGAAAADPAGIRFHRSATTSALRRSNRLSPASGNVSRQASNCSVRDLGNRRSISRAASFSISRRDALDNGFGGVCFNSLTLPRRCAAPGLASPP